MADATNLNRLAYFAAVVDTGSFTRAAERLGITKAVVTFTYPESYAVK